MTQALLSRVEGADAAGSAAKTGRYDWFAAASAKDRTEWICDGMTELAGMLFSVPVRELRAPGRCCARVARVRQIAMYVTHVALQISMTEIGRGFGRDRTTVIHACHLVEDMREDPDFDSMVTRVEHIAMAAFGEAQE